MAEMDLTNLAARIKKRLDEVFPEEPAGDDLNGRKSSLVYALKDLGGIAGALQWKIPMGVIRKYLLELNRLQPAFAGEKHITLLIKMQSELCRYMLARRRRLNPQALVLLLKSFGAMHRLADSQRFAPARRQELVRRLLLEYLTFKETLVGGRPAGTERGAAAARRPHDGPCRRRPASPDRERPFSGEFEKKAYYLIPVEEVERLRGYILADYNRLRQLIQNAGSGAADSPRQG